MLGHAIKGCIPSSLCLPWLHHSNIVSSVFLLILSGLPLFFFTKIYMNLCFKVLWCFTPCWNFKCLSMPYFFRYWRLIQSSCQELKLCPYFSTVRSWCEAIRRRRSQVFTGSNLNNLYILIPNSISQRSYTMSYPHPLLRTCNVAPFGRNAATKRRWWR
jgi:hypothetical protein